ncbi:MAG: peptidoglycan-binding protein [Candidatus Liberibacter ctenarytainae]|uniref:Peptidoglycan-binding protein n=1 Tax=Candidatus Liberibacter ctenarytainae TaxID=2020335 RepID=A0A937AD66_9HYPH|nr:peptidoglycan-binding protein [Candidatus Liberibacter ctenarytainae]
MTIGMQRKMYKKGYDISFLGVSMRIIQILGKMISSHPTLILMTTGYAVIFMWILFNALWGQRGKHPSPIFVTRHLQSGKIVLGAIRASIDLSQEKVMSFKVERSGDNSTITFLDHPIVPDKKKKLLKEIQKKLQDRGLYQGSCEGDLNQSTIDSINSFQRKNNIPVDGIPSHSLLNILKRGSDQSDFSNQSSKIIGLVPNPPSDLIADIIMKDLEKNS